MHTVAVSYKRRHSGRLRWVVCSAPTAPEAYALIRAGVHHARLISEGFREYGVQGLAS